MSESSDEGMLPRDLSTAITKAYQAGHLRCGASRLVMIAGDKAFKFARGDYGRACNLFEKATWDASEAVQHRRDRLCPVLDISADGAVLVMAVASPLLAGQDPKQLGDWWEYRPPGQGCPAEHKVEDWGFYEGRMVCVDYAASVLHPDALAALDVAASSSSSRTAAAPA